MSLNVHEVFVVDSAGVTTIERKERPPTVRLWDENWNFITEVRSGWRIDSPETIVLPWSDPAAKWLWDTTRVKSLVHLVVDYPGGRRKSGWMVRCELVDGSPVAFLRAEFNEWSRNW
ncbi:hypothetical protein [Rhodococcus erythropolis]|uniref:hypothetical protein n=1 Tax=Rhodococcus erythropolis TaxID=1833 RepID=UPI00366D5BC1